MVVKIVNVIYEGKKMIKILLGGSPCTYWSIAQTKNRETQPGGLGWELFENYLIAKEKFKPDFFLYENNVSASRAIKDEIKRCFGVGETDARYIEINSALVSAQNRRRFYVHNCGDVGQPENRKIIFWRDVKETNFEKCKPYKVNRTPSRELMWKNGYSVRLIYVKTEGKSAKEGCLEVWKE